MPVYTLQNREYVKWRILVIWAYKIYFALPYFELIFIWDNILASILDKKLFEMRFICYNFLYYKMINLDSITNGNN